MQPACRLCFMRFAIIAYEITVNDFFKIPERFNMKPLFFRLPLLYMRFMLRIKGKEGKSYAKSNFGKKTRNDANI